MKTAELKVEPRQVASKSENRRLRREGFVPANVYGPGVKNAYCHFDERDLQKLFRGQSNMNLMISLKSSQPDLEGKRVILKSVERDPASWRALHADFYEINMSRPITVSVPLEFQGTPVGVKIGGGILQIVRRSIQVHALPDQLPEKIEVDISALEVGSSLHVSDLKTADSVEILDSGEYTLALVAEPQKEEEPVVVAPAEGEGAAAASATAAAAGDKPDEAPKKTS